MDRKIVDMLTQDSVSILTQKMIEVDGFTYTLGNHRQAYANSTIGRDQVAAEQPADVVAAVMARWGDTPTIDEQDMDDMPQ